MGRDPIMELGDEDRGLRVGMPVVARWSAGGFAYHGRAEVVALAPTEVTVRLEEAVDNGSIGSGRQLTLPRLADAGRWSSDNCVRAA
jgi:hypothetical protein